MWTRKDVKTKGRTRFFATYWATLLVALILSILLGNSSSTAGGRGLIEETGDSVEADEDINGHFKFSFDIPSADELKTEIVNDEIFDDVRAEGPAALAIAFAVIGFLLLFIAIIGIGINTFLINPLIIGCQTYFRRNLDENCSLKALGRGFGSNYLNGVKVMFLRDLFTFLWTLLFIVPGIIKRYEYRMIPYIISDNPDMAYEEAFAESKRLMSGQKWKAFVYDLSFLGWYILGLLTCGFGWLFFVNPYKYQSDAALYEVLLDNGNDSVIPSGEYVEI